MSKLRDFLVALTQDAVLRREYQENPAEVLERYLNEEQINWIGGRNEEGFDAIEISYEFRADLDSQEPDPDVVVKLKVPPGPTPPPVW